MAWGNGESQPEEENGVWARDEKRGVGIIDPHALLALYQLTMLLILFFAQHHGEIA